MSKKHHKQSGKKKHHKSSHQPNHPKKQKIKQPQPNHDKKKKKRHKKGISIGKVGKGIVKRADTVGKFTGGIIKNQANAMSNLTNALANPIVIIGIGAVVVFVMLNK